MNKNLKNFLWIAISLCLVASFFSCSSNKATSKENIPLSMNSAIISGTLENGMDYYVQQNSNPENRIQLRLVVNAGSLMEEDDQLGVAHLVEHMAFNGSENFSKNEVIEFFESTGMAFGHDLNAYTSFEQTVYMLEIPADNPEFLEKAMLILKDWASGLTFVQEELDKFKMWEKLHFDILFVGDDWFNTPSWQEMENKFKEVGVRVVYFPYTKGTSSTLINKTLNDIREQED